MPPVFGPYAQQEPPQFVPPVAPPWATVGRKVRSKTGVRGVINSVDPAGVTVVLSDGSQYSPSWAGLAVFWEPVDKLAADASLEQVKGAILHELRSSGPLGLSRRELEDRIGRSIDAAVDLLLAEGRVRWSLDGYRSLLCLTVCQRALDEAEVRISEALGEVDAVRRDRTAAERAVATRLNTLLSTAERERDEARARAAELDGALYSACVDAERAARERDEARAAEAALRRGVESLREASGLVLASELQKALDGASAEGVHLLDDLDDARERLACAIGDRDSLEAALAAVEHKVIAEREEIESTISTLRRELDAAVAEAERLGVVCEYRLDLDAALNSTRTEGDALQKRLDEAERVARCEAARAVDAEKAVDELRRNLATTAQDLALETERSLENAEFYARELARLRTIIGEKALSAIGEALEAHAGSAADDGALGPKALIAVFFQVYATTEGSRVAAHGAALVAVAEHVRHVIGRTANRLHSYAFDEPAAYIRGLQDAAYVASYGSTDPRRPLSVRVLFQDGTTARVLLLNDLASAPWHECTGSTRRFILGSARFDRMFADADGRIDDSARIHPDDLAALTHIKPVGHNEHYDLSVRTQSDGVRGGGI